MVCKQVSAAGAVDANAENTPAAAAEEVKLHHRDATEPAGVRTTSAQKL
jgi:hypothetical protein